MLPKFPNSAECRAQPAGVPAGNRQKYTCMAAGCRCSSAVQCSAVPCRAVLPLRCWPSAVSGLQRLWGWAAGGGAPRELSLGQWGCPSSRHISILLTWPLTHPHGHWPPNWKPRTKAAPLCGQSSRDCQCFFNLSIAVVLCW